MCLGVYLWDSQNVYDYVCLCAYVSPLPDQER